MKNIKLEYTNEELQEILNNITDCDHYQLWSKEAGTEDDPERHYYIDLSYDCFEKCLELNLELWEDDMSENIDCCNTNTIGVIDDIKTVEDIKTVVERLIIRNNLM